MSSRCVGESMRELSRHRSTLVAATTLQAQQAPLPIADGQVLRLWEGAAPGAQGSDESDMAMRLGSGEFSVSGKRKGDC